jgi:sugar (pentulose or hexulose) kinase
LFLQGKLMQYILAIDNGTQSVRALLFDLKGNLAAKVRVPIEPYFSRHPGWAEQEPTVFWDATCQACQKLWQTSDIPKSSVAGVALTTQRGTVINLDANGQPLRPAIIWLDQRRTEGLPPVGGLWGIAFKLVRMSETVAYVQAEAEGNWIRVHQPDIWDKTSKFMLLSGYLTFRLTGRLADSVGCQVTYMPFDYKAQAWAGSRDWKWQAMPIDRAKLVDLVPPGQIIGQITAEAAEATGIPAGLPWIAAAADKACEVIGSGALQPHIGCLSYGTTATINTTHKRYIDLSRLLDGELVQTGIWRTRNENRPGSGSRTGIPARRTAEPGATRFGWFDPATVLDAGNQSAWAGGAGRDYRLWRLAYAGTCLPRYSGRRGLCAARGQRADRTANPCADHRTARFRWRLAE